MDVRRHQLWKGGAMIAKLDLPAISFDSREVWLNEHYATSGGLWRMPYAPRSELVVLRT